MKDLRLTILQTPLLWEDNNGNLMFLEEQLRVVKKNSTDIIVLPEMFNTGFTMNAARVAETMQGTGIGWLKNIAVKKNSFVCGSLIIKERGKYFNRLIMMAPDGTYHHYDKRHLFRMAGEDKVFTGGKKHLTVMVKGWKVSPFICYDLRFPVWCRTTSHTDLMIFIANWPQRRYHAWSSLLLARAIENQCYVAGVNRVGTDGKGIAYSGDSAILDPWGNYETQIIQNTSACLTVRLRHKKLTEIRKNFPAFLDADKFKILV
jgi:predicted amidohydrolase